MSIQTVGGKAFDPEATYTIATNDFLAAGGDTYYAFSAATVNYDLGLAMDEVVMDYITEELGGTVTAKDYGAAQGRITIQGVNPFTDVTSASPYYEGILWAVDQDITNGTTATTFSPSNPCTRAQIVTFLWRAAGSPEPTLTEQQYTDVTNTNAYYYKALLWAAEQGMETGDTFRPDDPCTRMEAVYFMWCAAGSPETEADLPFTDVAAESDDCVAWAVEKGVTNGTTATTFSPDNSCTRGQIATFLYRAANAA